ncbi:MAG: adenine deaminase [bacterium]|nr:adenine deaminase [bacterium]
MGLQKRIAVARGDEAADFVLKGGRLLNVFSGMVETLQVAVVDGVVAGLGESFETAEVFDLDGAFIAPAFMDAHIHLESAMVTPDQFAKVATPRGTGTLFADPHEIANVLGVDGVRYLLRACEQLPLSVFMMAPSCVPATHLESSGASLSVAEIEELLKEPRVLGLAEMMNYPGVVFRDSEVLARLTAAEGRPVDGHAPGLKGRDLQAYAAAGIGSDHECVTADDARARLAQGMYVMAREGSSARNLETLMSALTPENSAHWLLCTDDKTPADLLATGHVDHLIRRAVRAGVPPMIALRMATLNAARYFGLHDRGALLPGRRADIVVFDSFDDLRVSHVWHGGDLVAEGGRLLREPETVSPPPARLRVANLPQRPFALPDPGGELIRVIGVRPDQLLTTSEELPPARDGGELISDCERDILKLAVVERHHGTGHVGLGFIRGFGLRKGALATTVAHDSHNVILVGADDKSLAFALRSIIEMGGGKLVVEDERVLAALPLPVAGLMSPSPIEETASRHDDLVAAARTLGCGLPEPFMTLSFMALPVIPHLKLTDLGLVDVAAFGFVPLAVE